MSTSTMPNLAYLKSLPRRARERWIHGLTDREAHDLLYDWSFHARPEQLWPEAPFRWWIISAGRSWGKTRVGAETVKEAIRRGYRYITLVGATVGDVRRVMLRGESGLMGGRVFPPEVEILHEPTKLTVTFPHDYPDVAINLITGDQPEQARGIQSDFAWFDEFAKMRYAEEIMYNVNLGLRLGKDWGVRPCGLVTTTPKPLDELRKLIRNPRNYVAGRDNQAAMHSIANRANVHESFWEDIYAQYQGTRLGRQELEARLEEAIPGALWTSVLLDHNRLADFPEGVYPVRTVVAVDPATSSPERDFDPAEYAQLGKHHPEIGIIVASRGSDGHCYIRFDGSIWDTPLTWAARAVELWRGFDGDAIVAEKNQGGVLVESNIRSYFAHAPLRMVWASQGKQTRAEPVSLLYERGLVHHVGPAENFGRLEDQLVHWVPGTGSSPDRLDALVWAVWDLMLDGAGQIAEPATAGRIAVPTNHEAYDILTGRYGGASVEQVYGMAARMDTVSSRAWRIA